MSSDNVEKTEQFRAKVEDLIDVVHNKADLVLDDVVGKVYDFVNDVFDKVIEDLEKQAQPASAPKEPTRQEMLDFIGDFYYKKYGTPVSEWSMLDENHSSTVRAHWTNERVKARYETVKSQG